MSGERLFAELRGQWHHNGCWSVLVAEVVLDYEDGTATALFATLRGREIGVINIATAYDWLIVFHCMYFPFLYCNNIIPHLIRFVNSFLKINKWNLDVLRLNPTMRKWLTFVNHNLNNRHRKYIHGKKNKHRHNRQYNHRIHEFLE